MTIITFANEKENTILVKVEKGIKNYLFVLPRHYKVGVEYLENTIDKMIALDWFSLDKIGQYTLGTIDAVELMRHYYEYDLTGYDALEFMLDKTRQLEDLTTSELKELNLGKCEDCGDIYSLDDMREVYNGDLICEGCLDDYVWCRDIEDYVREEDAYVALDRDQEEVYYHSNCELRWSDEQDCYIEDEYAVRAYRDSSLDDYDYVHRDYACDNCYWSEIADEYFLYCDDRDNYDYDHGENEDYCEDEMPDDWLSSYSNHSNEFFKYDNGQLIAMPQRYIEDRQALKDFEGIGTELEVEPSENSNEYDTFDKVRDITYNNGDRLVMLKRDGSLCDHGVEIVTNPMTFEAFENSANIWHDMLSTLRKNGYTSHDNGRCGLHFHISRTFFGKTEKEQDDNIKKMIKFYNDNYDNIVSFSRRTQDQCNDWCRRYSEIYNEEAFEETYKYYNKAGHDSRRYMAVNITNEHTVEIRIMRGTLKENTFWASYDFVKTIAKNSKEMTWEQVNANDLNKWFNGIEENTKQYAISKDAFTSVFSN